MELPQEQEAQPLGRKNTWDERRNCTESDEESDLERQSPLPLVRLSRAKESESESDSPTRHSGASRTSTESSPEAPMRLPSQSSLNSSVVSDESEVITKVENLVDMSQHMFQASQQPLGRRSTINSMRKSVDYFSMAAAKPRQPQRATLPAPDRAVSQASSKDSLYDQLQELANVVEDSSINGDNVSVSSTRSSVDKISVDSLGSETSLEAYQRRAEERKR